MGETPVELYYMSCRHTFHSNRATFSVCASVFVSKLIIERVGAGRSTLMHLVSNVVLCSQPMSVT